MSSQLATIFARKSNPLSLFFRALIFLLGRQLRNVDTLPWMKPSGSGGPQRTHLFFVFLRVSVPPWCKGLVFGCGFVALCFKVLILVLVAAPSRCVQLRNRQITQLPNPL